MGEQQAKLLPEADWKHCQKCKHAIPDFALAEPLKRELEELFKQHDAAGTMTLLVQEAGCEPIVAKGLDSAPLATRSNPVSLVREAAAHEKIKAV